MKCIFCDSCREYIRRGEPVWQIDSVFEHEIIHTCQKCAELYNGYPEALKRLQGEEYDKMNWFKVVTSRFGHDD